MSRKGPRRNGRRRDLSVRSDTWGWSSARRERRRRRRWAIVKTILVFAMLGGAGWFAYATGEELARVEVDVLQEELDVARGELDRLRAENASLARGAETARGSEAQWRRRYEQEVPQGEIAELVTAIEGQISAGVPVERLRFVVDAVEAERSCAEETTTKRFLVRTPLFRGANDAVAFAGGTITITASGVGARNAQGQRESWFDPAEPIDLRLAQAGGDETPVAGKLPLHFSLVRGVVEHRFSAHEGERGFVEITEFRCDYP